MSAAPSREAMEAAIREILDGAELEGITQRQLRTQLEEKFGQDLTEQKGAIKEITIAVLAEREEEDDEEEDEDEELLEDEDEDDEDDDEEEEAPKASKAKRKKASGGGGGGGNPFNKEQEWSAEMSAFLGTSHMSRPQVTKAIWDHIKKHDLQNPNDKRQILCDAALKKLFGVDSVHMFTMAKFVNKHVKGYVPKAEDSDDDGGGASKKRKAAPKPKKPAAKKGKAAGGEGSEKKKASFPVERISPALAAVVGKGEASRNEVVKALWDYVKARGLQNPADKREINCDATLKAVFNMDSVNGFSMNKYLKPHFLGRV